MPSEPAPAIALIDFDFWSGGHFQYTYCYCCEALLIAGCQVVAVCPDPEYLDSWLQKRHVSRTRLMPHHTPPIPNFLKPLRRKFRTLQPWIYWWLAGRLLGKIQKNTGQKIAGAYFVWFPTLALENRFASAWIDAVFPFPWSARWNESSFLRMPGQSLSRHFQSMKSRGFRSITIVDEGTVPALTRILGEHRAIPWPDFTDQTLPDHPPVLVEEIRQKSRGRPIVSCLGVLDERKNFAFLLSYALRHPEFFFVFAGPLYLESFSPEKRREIEGMLASVPENILAHTERISGDAEFNSLVNATDVIYAVYKNFANSSNLLNKAAVFQKPIVVAKGFCMAERVEKHHFGEAVWEDDEEALTRSLQRLTQKQPFPRENFISYAKEHSMERLQNQIKTMVLSLADSCHPSM
jgi:hypothetical protein